MLFVGNLKTQISKQEKIKNTLIPALGDKPCKYFGILVDILPVSPFFSFETFSFLFNYTSFRKALLLETFEQYRPREGVLSPPQPTPLSRAGNHSDNFDVHSA